jgi:hypothetical protein
MVQDLAKPGSGVTEAKVKAAVAKMLKVDASTVDLTTLAGMSSEEILIALIANSQGLSGLVSSLMNFGAMNVRELASQYEAAAKSTVETAKNGVTRAEVEEYAKKVGVTDVDGQYASLVEAIVLEKLNKVYQTSFASLEAFVKGSFAFFVLNSMESGNLGEFAMRMATVQSLGTQALVEKMEQLKARVQAKIDTLNAQLAVETRPAEIAKLQEQKSRLENIRDHVADAGAFAWSVVSSATGAFEMMQSLAAVQRMDVEKLADVLAQAGIAGAGNVADLLVQLMSEPGMTAKDAILILTNLSQMDIAAGNVTANAVAAALKKKGIQIKGMETVTDVKSLAAALMQSKDESGKPMRVSEVLSILMNMQSIVSANVEGALDGIERLKNVEKTSIRDLIQLLAVMTREGGIQDKVTVGGTTTTKTITSVAELVEHLASQESGLAEAGVSTLNQILGIMQRREAIIAQLKAHG